MRNWVVFGLPVGLVLAGFIAYSADALPERTAGAILAALCVLAPGPYAGWRVAQVVKSDRLRGVLIAAGLVLAVVCAIPVYFALFPGEARYTGSLSQESKSLSIGSIVGGAYVLTVEGALPEREGEVTAEYRLKLKTGERESAINGEIWRRFDQVRVGRRGSAMQEKARTYDRHRVWLADGNAEFQLAKLTTLDTIKLELHQVLLPASAFWILAALLCLLGVAVEARFGTEQVRALVSTLFVFSVTFAVLFPDQVTQAAFVRPAFGAGIASLFIAIGVGGIAAWIGRKWFRPASD